jgi:hypothetical protein
MSDGAHLGYGAEAAMKAVMGDKSPVERETAGQMFERIMATSRDDANTYDGVATYMAKLIIVAFQADPALADQPIDNVYGRNLDGSTDFDTVVTPGLWEVLRDRLDPADRCPDMTGFMWGWAVNAARRCLELGPVPNPAIITIGE